MNYQLRGAMCALASISAAALIPPATARAQETLRIVIGPYLPTPTDSQKAYEPFAKYLSEKLKRPYSLTAVNEWAGIIVALATNRVDVAWMGPWSYILSNKESGAQAIATVKYQGSPTYEALIVARKGLEIKDFPQGAKGLRLGLSDVGGTSGWLIPTWYLTRQGIDPKSFFVYRDGATHTANLIAVASGQLDLSSSYDRIRNELITRKVVTEDASQIVWRYKLPNDAIVVRNGLDPKLRDEIQKVLVDLTEEDALKVLPRNYTGFAAADATTYASIAEAGREVGILK